MLFESDYAIVKLKSRINSMWHLKGKHSGPNKMIFAVLYLLFSRP